MRKIIFIILKIIETVLAFTVVAFIAWFVGFDVFIEWVYGVIGIRTLLILDLVFVIICFAYLVSSGFFKYWFGINWRWTDSIILIFKNKTNNTK